MNCGKQDIKYQRGEVLFSFGKRIQLVCLNNSVGCQSTETNIKIKEENIQCPFDTEDSLTRGAYPGAELEVNWFWHLTFSNPKCHKAHGNPKFHIKTPSCKFRGQNKSLENSVLHLDLKRWTLGPWGITIPVPRAIVTGLKHRAV